MSTNLIKMAEHVKMQGKHIDQQSELLYESIKYVEEVAKEVRASKEQIMKVGSFMVDFYNEYHDHKELSTAQTKELKKVVHDKTTEITKILHPRLIESRKRGSEYLKRWTKINRGLWSIFKTNVNNSSVPYDRTPQIKFKQALEYAKNLSVEDYTALRMGDWGSIKKFIFKEDLDYKKMSIREIVGGNDNPIDLLVKSTHVQSNGSGSIAE